MDSQTLMAGKYEMAIGATLIPAQLLGDITINYEEGQLEANTQSGTRRMPNGKADTAEVTFTLYLPNMDYLKVLFADAYNEPSGTQKSGNLIFGGSSCTTAKGLPINIHSVCDNTDDNDIHIFDGIIRMTFNPTLSTSDAISIEAGVDMQPTENGYFRLGTGDLTQPSYYDVASQTTKPRS